MIEVFVVVDKPKGWVSFKLVSSIRRLTGQKKVGFAGILDPFASGVMMVAMGRPYTRQLDDFHALPKQYTLTMILGRGTDTLDCDGTVLYEQPFYSDVSHVESVIQSFVGLQAQVPPSFSAKKVNGKKSYELARKGIHMTLAPVNVDIYGITLLAIDAVTTGFWHITLTVRCSKGTYIRSLVRDIADRLGTQGMAQDLRRDAIGPYDMTMAIPGDTLSLSSIEASLFKAQV